MLRGVFAGRMRASQLCRKPSTMPVEPGLIVALSFKMAPVITLTQFLPTVLMLLIATIRGRVRLREPAISPELPPSSPPIQVAMAALILPLKVLQEQLVMEQGAPCRTRVHRQRQAV